MRKATLLLTLMVAFAFSRAIREQQPARAAAPPCLSPLPWGAGMQSVFLPQDGDALAAVTGLPLWPSGDPDAPLTLAPENVMPVPASPEFPLGPAPGL